MNFQSHYTNKKTTAAEAGKQSLSAGREPKIHQEQVREFWKKNF
jgi:hypothetical protein